jgi:hypothetical protein
VSILIPKKIEIEIERNKKRERKKKLDMQQKKNKKKKQKKTTGKQILAKKENFKTIFDTVQIFEKKRKIEM